MIRHVAFQAQAAEIDPDADLSSVELAVPTDPEAGAHELGFESTSLVDDDYAAEVEADFGEIDTGPEEGERMLASTERSANLVALDVRGKVLDTPRLADQLRAWMQDGRNVELLIGGPDGLAPACLENAAMRWSLSPLTLPHGLVRVVVAEQLYRAISILKGHPYHRE